MTTGDLAAVTLKATSLRPIGRSSSWRLCGAALGWFALSIYKINDVTVPILPWSLPVVILVAAIATWGYARAFRTKVVDPQREVEANQGLVSLALGKAIALSGAALVGACIVYVLTFVWHLNIPYPRQRAIVGGVTAITCAAMAWLDGSWKTPVRFLKG